MTTTPATNYTATGTAFVKTNAATDPYTDDELQLLEEAVDQHDHSATRGLAVQRVGAGVIVEANLANDAVTFDKLADHASTDSSRAVGTNHIRDLAVTTAKLATGAVTATKLGAGATSGLAFPRVYAGYTVSSQTLTTSTLTTVAFGAAEIYDSDTMHSPTVNNTRLTINTAGWYLLFGFAKFAANATGNRELYMKFTRSGVPAFLQTAMAVPAGGATVTTMVTMASPYELQVGDFVELIVWQNSGGNLGLTDAGFGATALGV